jgi:predicted metal-dependent phosphoesterase TrpH
VAEAQAAARAGLEVVPGVEISASHAGREFHLLGYFVRTDNGALVSALARLRDHRASRFWEMVGRLRRCGVRVEEEELRRGATGKSLGRRFLADFLVRTRQASSVREVFARYLGDEGRAALPKVCLPVGEAIAVVRGAGGVASWAHPSYHCTRQTLREMRDLGLGAVEVEYPTLKSSRTRELRGWAAELDLAVSGGSDCHGPDRPARSVGCSTVTALELQALRRRAFQGGDAGLPATG